MSLAGFYLYNASDEPCANSIYPGLNEPNRFIDRSDYLLIRRVNMLALNNTWIPGNNTVATLRYGFTKFVDDDTLSIDYDPAQLGFSQNFLSQMQVQKFPRVTVTDYYAFGAIDPTPRNWYSWSANGTVSKLLGSHTFKLGADWRTIGIKTQSFTNGAGTFFSDRFYTSNNPLTNGTTNTGNAMASLLLGYPSGQPGNESLLTVSSPFNAFTHYWGAYLQDDWRASSKFTLNYGVRLEHEAGLREENNGLTVAFDRTLNPGGTLGSVVTVNGQPVRGGLVYAGVNGAQRVPGQPAGDQVLAARRHGLLAEPEDGGARRLRPLLGAVELPGRQRHQLRQRRLHAGQPDRAGPVPPDGVADQPVPERHRRRSAAARAARSKASAARSSSSIRTRRRR